VRGGATLGTMNDIRIREAATLRQAIAGLGFRPALLDYASMTIHWSLDGLAAPPRLTLLAGFERNGFFYTRAAAERAAREWR
jgi:hypothetical protein